MIFLRTEKILKPIKPGDAQVQRSSLVDNFDQMLIDACEVGRRDYRGLLYNGYTYEIVPDGAGVKHYNLTVHYQRQGPGLNPLNLNEASEPIFTNVLSESDLAAKGIGRFDTRWKGY